MADLKNADMDTTSVVNRIFMNELEAMKQLSKLNLLEHNKHRNKFLMLGP